MLLFKLFPFAALYVVLSTTLATNVATCEELDLSLTNSDMFSAGSSSSSSGHNCDDCGLRCKMMCRTRKFRLCCMQYMRKRSDMNISLPPSASSYNNNPPNIFLDFPDSSPQQSRNLMWNK